MTTAFWILSGLDFIREGQQSAATLRRHMPDVRRILFTPDLVDACKLPEYHRVIALPAREHEFWYLDVVRWLGMTLGHFTTGERLIYLDGDTYICAPFYDFLECLDAFDLVGVAASARQTGQTVEPLPRAFPEINVGVLGMWAGSRTQMLARDWYNQYRLNVEIYGNNDQLSLRELLWQYSRDSVAFRFYATTQEYNCRLFGAFLCGPARVLHGRTRDIAKLAEQANHKQRAMRIWRPGIEPLT